MNKLPPSGQRPQRAAQAFETSLRCRSAAHRAQARGPHVGAQLTSQGAQPIRSNAASTRARGDSPLKGTASPASNILISRQLSRVLTREPSDLQRPPADPFTPALRERITPTGTLNSPHPCLPPSSDCGNNPPLSLHYLPTGESANQRWIG